MDKIIPKVIVKVIPSKTKTFEECLSIIDEEIRRHKNCWTLTSVQYLDYSDISQILRIHIWKKWHLYQQNRPLKPWLNIVIRSQIKNLIRNLYSNFSRPCLKCYAAIDNDGCKIYKTQCEKCPLFANWLISKKPAMNIKVPVTIENHVDEVRNIFDDSYDVSKNIGKAHIAMKKILKPLEFQIYEGLFILHEDESVVAKKLGYISNERGRNPGYKQIKNQRKVIINKFKKALKEGQIDIL